MYYRYLILDSVYQFEYRHKLEPVMFCKKSPDGFEKLILFAFEPPPRTVAYILERYIFTGYEKVYKIFRLNTIFEGRK